MVLLGRKKVTSSSERSFSLFFFVFCFFVFNQSYFTIAIIHTLNHSLSHAYFYLLAPSSYFSPSSRSQQIDSFAIVFVMIQTTFENLKILKVVTIFVHAHTHTHTRARASAHTHTHTLSLSLPLSHTHTHARARACVRNRCTDINILFDCSSANHLVLSAWCTYVCMYVCMYVYVCVSARLDCYL